MATPGETVDPATLAENISDIQEKDRFDVVLANPPFNVDRVDKDRLKDESPLETR